MPFGTPNDSVKQHGIVLTKLHGTGDRSIDFGKQIEATPGIFDKMFKTFKILQQAPSYQDALTQGKDLTDAATVRRTLARSRCRSTAKRLIASASTSTEYE